MRNLLTIGCVVGAMLGTPGASAQAQDPRPVVAEVRRVIAADYVVRDKRAALDAALAHSLAAGRYAEIDGPTLAGRINEDLDAVSHDAHLNLHWAPEMAASMPAPRDDNATDPAADEQARRWNHGVTELKVLDGNIRYLNYRGFMWTGQGGRDSAAALDNAMAFLRGGDAIVIDLRQNGGGDPRAVRHLASYLVPAGARLATYHVRSLAPSPQYAEPTVPGGRIVGKPVYLLTSHQTVSAPEEFASHAATFGFGTIVGETTRGAAFRNALYPVAAKYVLSVSIGRTELSGGGNWEGVGVRPQIAVVQDKALEAAQAAIFRIAADRSSGPDRAVSLRSAAYHEALVKPGAAGRAASAYVGRYGQRVVRLEGGTLTIQRDGGPVSTLVPLGRDRFVLSGDPITQASFAGTGTVNSLIIERVDGSNETAERKD